MKFARYFHLAIAVTRQSFLLSNLSFSLLCVSMASYAVELPEVVVTAQLRQSDELSVPSSMSVVSEQVITARAAQHFEEVINTIPNVNFSSGSNRARYFQIRGIGERSQFVSPLNASVGLLVDGVDFSGVGSIATMLDVDQIEVLRGPQGTIYGANALAGLINIKTKDPHDEFEAGIRLTAGEYGHETLSAVLNGALTDKIKARVAVEQHESDGYYENEFLGSDDNNARDELTIRGKFAVDVTDAWDINLALSHVDIDNGYDAFTLDNSRNTLSDEPGHDRQESNSLALESIWKLNNFDLELTLGLARSDIEYGYDEDWTFVGIHPFGYSSKDNYLRDRDTESLEVRMISNDQSKLFADSTDWLVGIYALSSSEDLTRIYTFAAADFSSQYKFDTLAMFLQLDTSFTQKLSLSTGLRFEQRDSSYDNSDAVDFNRSEDLWGGRIALQYFLSDQAMSYVSVARGYKAGGVNADGTLPADLREFDEEYLIEYEVGIKARMLNNRLHVRAAMFLDDRHDQQVKSSLTRPIAGSGGTEFIDFIGNAAEGTNKGIEVEIDWFAFDNLKLSANVGLLEAQFDEFINEFGEDLSGRDQAHAPAYTYHVAGEYSLNRLSLQLSVDGKDEFYFSDRHAVQSDSYALLNANITYATDTWTLSLWGRNLTDEDVQVRAFGSFGNDPRKGYVTEPYLQYGEPSIVGLTFGYEF